MLERWACAGTSFSDEEMNSGRRALLKLMDNLPAAVAFSVFDVISLAEHMLRLSNVHMKQTLADYEDLLTSALKKAASLSSPLTQQEQQILQQRQQQSVPTSITSRVAAANAAKLSKIAVAKATKTTKTARTVITPANVCKFETLGEPEMHSPRDGETLVHSLRPHMEAYMRPDRSVIVYANTPQKVLGVFGRKFT